MNIVRGFAAGAAPAPRPARPRACRRMPQNANPGAIGLPQVAQMTSRRRRRRADSRGAEVRGWHCRWPACRRRWRRCYARPRATLRPRTRRRRRPRRCDVGRRSLHDRHRRELRRHLRRVVPGDAALGLGRRERARRRAARSPGCRRLDLAGAVAIGGGVASPPRPPAGTNSVRAIASGGGVRSVARVERGPGGAGRRCRGIGALGAAAGAAAGTAFASSFPHPRQNL